MQTSKKLLYVTLCVFLSITFSSFKPVKKGDPTWIRREYRDAYFPKDKFLVGFQVAENITIELKEENLINLKQLAKNELAESVSVRIESVSKLDIGSASGASYENFKQNSTSFSNVSLTGVKVEDYYDEKEQILYVFAYVNIKDLLQNNRDRISSYLEKIKSSKKQAENNITSGNPALAKKELRRVFPTFREIEELYSVSITLGDKVGLNYNEFLTLETDISKLLAQLNNREIASIKELSAEISSTLSDQVKISNQGLLLENFTFEDTKMGSKFSRKLNQLLELSLSTDGMFKVTNTESPSNKYVITGTIWENDDQLSIISILRDIETGSIIGSTDSKIKITALNNLSYKPQNLQQAMMVQQQFSNDVMENSGLSLEVITNKGNNSPIFAMGDIMSLFVKANRPCKVRFIYHMADGTKVLLLDNYTINQDQVNQMVKVSQEFQCYPPFGIETLQAFAKTGANFEPLNTTDQQGYIFINDDIETINAKNRKVTPENSEIEGGTEVAFAEKRVLITTLPAN
ncbi:hypothetical protein [Flammeovirga sp. SJP92]|uniref:hypothetical protein n=1 Tax=Flammeovirga sp. SJP92 TaxID=1775430 RepID=UPI000787F649|nr:hypothetical protein [Flammeovirga sp. SJP92]KXX68916.1 hypothetical protein AVL50_17300 [Flammeovirga sp. SJP92]